MSNILSNDIHYLWLNTCYRLDFSIDFNIIEVGKLRKSKTNNVAIKIDPENDAYLKKNGLTLEIKVNHQGYVIENGFLRSLTLRMLESTPRSSL